VGVVDVVVAEVVNHQCWSIVSQTFSKFIDVVSTVDVVKVGVAVVEVVDLAVVAGVDVLAGVRVVDVDVAEVVVLLVADVLQVVNVAVVDAATVVHMCCREEFLRFI
jgi:hypothetical protein